MKNPIGGHRGRLYGGTAALAVTAGLAIAPSAFAGGFPGHGNHGHPVNPQKPPVHHHHHHHQHQKPPFRLHKP